MKNVVNVSIAGIAFKLEEEAYSLLATYLDQIRAGYGNTSDGEEIVSDIEARIAELILTQQDATVTVSRPLIEETISRLGAPEDISEEGASGKKAEAAKEVSPTGSERRIPHRLYRNPEGAKFGGVCSGLGAYFNTDPAVIRLLFAAPLVLLVFFAIIGLKFLVPMMTGLMTTAFILYFLLWMVIPKAKTPLQRLEMKGEKITRDKLEKTFLEEFESRSNTPQNIHQRARNERNASVFSEFLTIIGKILLFFAKALVALIGFCLVVALVGVLAALIVVLIEGSSAVQGITATSPALLAVLLCLAVLIPLGLAVYGILKMLFGFNHNKPLISTLLVVWILTLVFGTVIVVKDFENIEFDDHINISLHDGSWWGRRSDRRNEERRNRREAELQEWHFTSAPLELASDTLFIAPMDSVRLPDGFVVKIRKEEAVTAPSLVIGKSYKGYKPGDDPQYLERITVDYLLRNDTLYLKPVIPNIPEVDRERACLEIKLPARHHVTVGNGINYNEYYNGK